MTRSIVISVTIDDSLQFHTGLPERLVSAGWEVHIVAGAGPRSAALALVPGVTVHTLDMARGPRPLRDLRHLLWWIRRLRALRPAIVLAGTPKAALLGLVAARLTRVPKRVYELFGLRYETATGLLRTVLVAAERVTAASATEVWAVSRSVESIAVRTRIVRRDRVRVIADGSCNGLDVRRYRALTRDVALLSGLRAELGLEDGVPVIGFVGRLTRDKGLPELADALALLGERGIRVQLLVVGGVDDPSGRDAQQRLGATGQRAVFAGYRSDPAPFYPLMDVFCLPSLREGLPNVVLEAMASGTTVVASDATGNVDLVVPGETGYLVARRSAEELAEGLDQALRDTVDNRRMAERAQTLVAERYSTERVQGAVIAALEETRAIHGGVGA